MARKPTIVGRLGEFPEYVTYTNFRRERAGFLTIYTVQASTQKKKLDVSVRGDAVVVLPIDEARREVYLIGELRHMIAFTARLPGGKAMHMTPDVRIVEPFTATGPVDADGRVRGEVSVQVPSATVFRYSCLAGGVEDLESIEAAACRETLEESGLRITPDRLTYQGLSYPSVGGSTERSYMFTANVTRKDVGQPTGDGVGDERIVVRRCSFEEAFAMCDAGEIDATTSLLLLTKLRLREAEAAGRPRKTVSRAAKGRRKDRRKEA